MGGCATAILAAADEKAVEMFIKGKIAYTDIAKNVETALERAPRFECDSFEAVMEAVRWVG